MSSLGRKNKQGQRERDPVHKPFTWPTALPAPNTCWFKGTNIPNDYWVGPRGPYPRRKLFAIPPKHSRQKYMLHYTLLSTKYNCQVCVEKLPGQDTALERSRIHCPPAGSHSLVGLSLYILAKGRSGEQNQDCHKLVVFKWYVGEGSVNSKPLEVVSMCLPT